MNYFFTNSRLTDDVTSSELSLNMYRKNSHFQPEIAFILPHVSTPPLSRNCSASPDYKRRVFRTVVLFFKNHPLTIPVQPTKSGILDVANSASRNLTRCTMLRVSGSARLTSCRLASDEAAPAASVRHAAVYNVFRVRPPQLACSHRGWYETSEQRVSAFRRGEIASGPLRD